MAAQSRTLKLSILADVDQLNKSLKSANSDVQSSSTRISDFGKKAGLAFAAAGVAAAAYAGKLLIDGVKSAIADEAAQAKLAATLQNVTGATTAQIAEVEKQITKTSLLTGVTDDELRPSFERLLRSTQDSSEALKLQRLALDIAAGSGKSLEAVSNALGKGLDGSTTALGKLGIGLSAAELKTMSMEEITAKLANTFGGQAAVKADTFAGRMDRLKVAFNESVETVGFAVLPILQKLVDLISAYILPIVQKFSEAMSSKSATGLGTRIQETVETIKTFAMPIFNGLVTVFNKVRDAIIDNSDSFESFFKVVKFIAPFIGQVIGSALSAIGSIASVVVSVFAKVLGAIEPVLNFAIKSINLIIKGLNLISPFKDIPTIPEMSKGTKVTDLGMIPGAEAIVIPKAATIVVPNLPSAGVSTAAKSATKAAETTTQAVIPLSPEVARVGQQGGLAAGVVAGVNLTVNQGIVGDPEAAARAVVDVLNRSYFRGTGGANALVAT